MKRKIYEFKPLFISRLTDILAFLDISLIVLSLIIVFGIIFLNWPILFILPASVAAISAHLYKNRIKDLNIEGYKSIKIDEHHHFIFLDDLAIPFSDIACAEVFFENILYILTSYKLYWYWTGNSGWQYFNLVNAEIILSLKNGTSMTVPVQNESCLKKMIFVLKKHIVVKENENNKNETMAMLLLIWATIAIIIWLIILLHK